MVGNLAAGVTTIPLNPKLGSAEADHIFTDSQPKLAFCSEGFEVRQISTQASIGEL